MPNDYKVNKFTHKMLVKIGPIKAPNTNLNKSSGMRVGDVRYQGYKVVTC